MIIPYSNTRHFETLKKWNEARHQEGLQPWMLPDMGFIIEDVALAFLVITNSPVAWIAHWTVNPKLSTIERDLAIHELTLHMEKEAKQRDYVLLQTMAMTDHNLLTRLLDHGFLAANGEFKFLVKLLQRD